MSTATQSIFPLLLMVSIFQHAMCSIFICVVERTCNVGFGKVFKRNGLTSSKEVGAQIHNGLEREEKIRSLALLALFIHRGIIRTKNLVSTFSTLFHQ